jgi:hypothetical protein
LLRLQLRYGTVFPPGPTAEGKRCTDNLMTA